MPSAEAPGHAHRRGRSRPRGFVLVAVGAAVAVAAAGWFVALPSGSDDQPATASEPGETRRRETPEPPAPASADQLLGPGPVAVLDPDARWRVAATGNRPARGAVYYRCNRDRAADPRRAAAYVRTYEADGRRTQVAVEALEVSRTGRAARRAHARLLEWYAGCQVPRVQLVDSARIARPGPDVTVLVLRRWSDPVRTVTVGVTRSGPVSAVVVHEVEGSREGAPRGFARVVGTALREVCDTSGGSCYTGRRLRAVPPPPTGETPGFLGVVDLPPVARLHTPWVGTRPMPADPNIAATLCDRASFTGPEVTWARSRTFVLPRARLPTRFGISQTTAVLRTPRAAADLVDDVSARIRACPDDQLSAAVDPTGAVRSGKASGRAWRLTYELPSGEVSYRVGLVAGGSAITQVTFSPTPRADVEPATFERLLLRAGQRLDELD